MPYGHDEANRVVLSVTDKGPFFLQPDPVAAFIAGVQKYLGAEVTGEWNVQTHDLWAAWVTRIPDDLTTEAALSKTLPAWASDPAWTAQAFLKSLNVLEEIPQFLSHIGMLNDASWTVQYPEWDTLRSEFLVRLQDHVAGQEAVVEPTPAPTETGIVPVPICQKAESKSWWPLLGVVGAVAVSVALLWWGSRSLRE